MDWRVAQAIATMERHLERPLSLAQLARRVDLSVSRFAHLFHPELGRSPVRYFRELRLDRARRLVEESNLPIREIMAAVGFNDPSHFARGFARRHGASPRKIRARARSPGGSHNGLVAQLSSTFGPGTGETAHSQFDDAVTATLTLENDL
jgi:transcriptional regulator GlxA family with amidase domain